VSELSLYDKIKRMNEASTIIRHLYKASDDETPFGIYVHPAKNRPEIIEALPGEVEESPSD